MKFKAVSYYVLILLENSHQFATHRATRVGSAQTLAA